MYRQDSYATSTLHPIMIQLSESVTFSHNLKFIIVIYLLSFMDLNVVANLHKLCAEENVESPLGKIKSFTMFGSTSSSERGCLNSHWLANSKTRIDDVGFVHGRNGTSNFSSNESLSANRFRNVDPLRYPPTKFISDSFSSSSSQSYEELDVQDYVKMTQLDDSALGANNEVVVPEYPSMPELIFSIDTSECNLNYLPYKSLEPPFPAVCLPFEKAFIQDSDDWIQNLISDPNLNIEN